MKMYATTTSERATKGQGGNKKIEITLLIDPVKRIEVGRVMMTHEEGHYIIYYYPINENCTDQKIKGGRVLLYETKGKEDECAIGWCAKHQTRHYNETKGKKQESDEMVTCAKGHTYSKNDGIDPCDIPF